MYKAAGNKADFTEGKRIESVLKILPVKLRDKILSEKLDFRRLQEIRLRAGQPLLLRYDGQERKVCRAVSDRITLEEIHETVQYAANYSLYAYEQEMRQGYLTIEGGHRVGMAGQVILDGGQIRNLRYVSSVNIRIAHEIPGCADKVLPFLIQDGDVFNTLIIAPPGCGKTTLLRDVIRQISSGTEILEGRNVGVVDERSEIGGSYMGAVQNDLGSRTDLLDACPKAEGMMMLVRSMGPQVIAVDEIGSMEEVQILKYAMCCGCRMLATVHGASLQEIRGKPMFQDFFTQKLFQRYLVLKHMKRPGLAEEIYDGQGERVC